MSDSSFLQHGLNSHPSGVVAALFGLNTKHSSKEGGMEGGGEGERMWMTGESARLAGS